MAINNYFNATPVSIDFNAVKQVDSKPAASGFADGNIIFDKTEQQFYQALSGSWIALDFIGDDFTVNKLAFNTAATETLATGELAWNADDETVDMHVGDDVTIQLGQEMVYHVINQTGTQIDNGTVVMADGALGASGKIKVVPAIADGSVPAKYIMGVATENIPNGALGYVTAFGKVRGFDTSSYSSGTVLYASATSSGSFTDTAPSLPNQKVTVAITLDQKSNGNIFVRPTYDDRRKTVSSISDLENVNTTENDVVYLDSGGRSGWFKWDDTDHSAATGTGFVDDDSGQGIYVAPSGEDGSNGAWVRDYSDYVSVLWFGADNTGTTDSTNAFNNALSLANHVVVPDGSYRIEGTVTITTMKTLEGVGFPDLNHHPSDLATDCIVIEGTTSSGNTFAGCLRNVNVRGQQDGETNGRDLIYVRKGDYPRIENVYVNNAVRNGVHFQPDENFAWIENAYCVNVRVNGAGQDAFSMVVSGSLNQVFINQSTFVNCETRSAIRHALRLYANTSSSAFKISGTRWLNGELGASGTSSSAIVQVEAPSTGRIEFLQISEAAIEVLGGNTRDYGIFFSGTMAGSCIIENLTTFGVTANVGNLGAWTNNYYFQDGANWPLQAKTPYAQELSGAVSISASGSYTIFSTEPGTIYKVYGFENNGDNGYRLEATVWRNEFSTSVSIETLANNNMSLSASSGDIVLTNDSVVTKTLAWRVQRIATVA